MINFTNTTNSFNILLSTLKFFINFSNKIILHPYIYDERGVTKALDIETMIDIYKDDVYKLCLKLTNNKIDADDLFQDTWLKLYSNFHILYDQKTYKNLIYTICINTYKDSYSKKKRWLNIITDFFDSKVQHEVMEHQSSTIDETEFIIFNTIEKKTIQNLIKDLDEKYKLPIILYYYLDYSYVDIASILNIPIGTLKYRLNQGKKLLKTKLENI